MIFPIRTDYRMTHRPWVNYLLIAANVALFVRGYHGGNRNIDPWLLQPDAVQLHQFFTSMFLHAGWDHLLGNMLFLWVFGNAVNDRLGQIGYLLFYLAGGVMAGVGYLVFTGYVPVLGASGAISAVTGAFLVLLPRTRITCLVFFFLFLTTFEISSLFFLAFEFAFNVYMLAGTMSVPGAGGVAYAAHSSGYVFGIAVAAVLLATRLLPRDPFDLLNLVRTWRRRGQYRRMVGRGYDPFYPSAAPPVQPGAARWVPARTVHTAPADTPSARELLLRREISESFTRRDIPAAAARYRELLGLSPDAVLSQPQQLDVANQLMAQEDYAAAAESYERFLRTYEGYENAADIFLMLGLLYGRYLHQYPRAAELLARAAEALRDPRKVELARADLDVVRRRMEP